MELTILLTKKCHFIWWTILCFTLLPSIDAFSQVKGISVEKVGCRHDLDKVDGYRLVVSIQQADTVIKTPATFYNLNAVIKLPDSLKLIVVKELLKFKGDTSNCCRKVHGFFYEAIERTCLGKPKSERYSIQIDALYMINKIVHPEGVSMYCCFPVVIDWKTKKELNDCPDLIMDYYSVYEKCLQEAYRTKLITESFRFNTRKYAWYGAMEETIDN